MFWTFLVILFNFHPVHLSIAELKPADKSMKGTLKVFADDWETAVGAQEKDADFRKKSEEYLQQHFYVLMGKKKISPVVLRNKSINTQQLVFWIEFKNAEVLKGEIHNTVLLNLFEDQQNLVHWGKKSFGFTPEKTIEKIEP
jgi:hypothetical protein